jgi:hypothetical protein
MPLADKLTRPAAANSNSSASKPSPNASGTSWAMGVVSVFDEQLFAGAHALQIRVQVVLQIGNVDSLHKCDPV